MAGSFKNFILQALGFIIAISLIVSAVAASGADLFRDDFERDLPGWTAVQPIGNYFSGPLRWEYDVANNAFVEQSNIYTDSSNGSSTAIAVMLINDTVAPDAFTFQARLTAGDDDGFGLIFGYQNESNFFRINFARQTRTTLFPWTGWNVDGKINNVTTNLFGCGTPGFVASFNNTANRPFDVAVSVNASNLLTLTVIDNPTGTPTAYNLVTNQPLPSVAGGRVGLMSWGMQSSTAPKSFRIQNVSLSPTPLTGSPNQLTNWMPVIPPNASGSKTLSGGNGGAALWALSVGKDGAYGLLGESSGAFGNATTIGTNANLDFVAPSLIAGDSGWSNYVVWTRIVPGETNGHGILLRYQDETNFCRIALASRATASGRPPKGLSIQKNVNRTWTEIFRESTVQYVPEADVAYDLIAEIATNRLKILLVSDPANAPQFFSYGPFDIASPVISTGKIGLFSWAQTNRTEFDFVNVQQGVPLYVSSLYGFPVPALGMNTFSSGTVISASVDVVVSAPGVRHAPTSWIGTGSVAPTGSGTNISFTLTNLSSIQWQWRTEYQVAVTAEIGGTISSPGDWFVPNTPVTLVAQPGPGYLFANWTGDISSASSNLTLTVDQPYALVAHFVADSDGDALPDDWEIGYFGDLSQTANGDFDNDGRDNLEEFRRGTNPKLTDLFHITGFTARASLATLNITNNTGTRYAVEMATNLPGPWQTIGSNQFDTNFSAPLPLGDKAFYRLSQPALPANVPPFVPGSFTLVVLPDTQNYSASYPEIFKDQTRWIVANRDRYNIRYVLHLGDIVDSPVATNQWVNAKAAMSILDGVVPYALVTGNHDHGLTGVASDRATIVNNYFPVSNYTNWPTFGGTMETNRIENSYHLFSAGGVDWLILALEWGPRHAVATWADQIVSQYPTRKVILITHAYMYYDDTRYDWATKGSAQSWNPHSYGSASDPGGTNDGEELWQKLVKKHPNFVMAFNGHVLNDGQARLTSLADFGNYVHQILVNYQTGTTGSTLGGAGFLRLVEFLPDGKTVQFKSYSPYSGTYKTDSANQFTLTLDPPLH